VGPSEITIQVQDQEKIWRTIFVADIWAFPLTFFPWIRLTRVEQFFVSYLPQLFLANRRKIATSVIPHLSAQSEASLRHNKLQTFTGKSDSTQSEIKTVHLFVTSKSNLFIREIAELLCAGFRAAGCEAQLLVDRIPAERTEGGKIQIVVTPHEFFNLFLSYKLSWEKIQRLTNHLFLLITSRHVTATLDSFRLDSPRRKRREVTYPLRNATACYSRQRSC